MKLNNFKFLCSSLILLASCNNAEISQSEVAAPAPVFDLAGCYMMTISKDTAFLKLNKEGNNVSGTLEYSRLKKRDSKGEFKGVINESKITIWYSSSVKEKAFVKQIVFRIIEDKLAEGYGDVIMKNDTAFYKYPTTLRYEDQHPFTKIPCNNF